MCSTSRCCCQQTREPSGHPRVLPARAAAPGREHQVASPQDVARGCRLKPARTMSPKANSESPQRDASLILTVVTLKFVRSFRKRKNCFFLSKSCQGPQGGGTRPSPAPQTLLQRGCPPGPPQTPLVLGSYILLHFLAQLLALPRVRLHQVLREEPGQPQRQPVGNWEEKFPSQTASLLVRETTQPEAGRVGTRVMLSVQTARR